MAIVTTKAIFTTSRAMPGNSTTNSFKAKTPRTCGSKTVGDLLGIVDAKENSVDR
jgi:hypothetical protein